MILRVPGIGVKSAKLILVSRRYGKLGSQQLQKMGIVLKKARYFITCQELTYQTIQEIHPDQVRKILTNKNTGRKREDSRQLKLQFEDD